MTLQLIVIALIIFGILEFALGYAAGRIHQFSIDVRKKLQLIEKKGD